MVTDTQILQQGLRSETQVLSGIWATLNLDFPRGIPDIAGKIQIRRQVFRTEIQISIIIPSPFCSLYGLGWIEYGYTDFFLIPMKNLY